MQQTQLCQECKTIPGKIFLFYYGKRLKIEVTQVTYKETRVTHNYQIDGTQQVPLCSNCVFQFGDRGKKSALKEGIIMVILAPLAYLFSSWLWSSAFSHSTVAKIGGFILLVISLGLFVGGLSSIFSAIRYLLSGEESQKKILLNDETGERLAISLKGREFTKQGYDIIWTPKQYKALEKK